MSDFEGQVLQELSVLKVQMQKFSHSKSDFEFP